MLISTLDRERVTPKVHRTFPRCKKFSEMMFKTESRLVHKILGKGCYREMYLYYILGHPDKRHRFSKIFCFGTNNL
jgi:hypothetical protein